jgi:flagellar motor protein MotB
MRRSRKQDAEETPWASFSDALSGILFVFVITTFWFALRLAVETQKLDQQQAQADAELARLTQADAAAGDLVETKGGTPGALTECLASGGVLVAQGERESKRISLYPKGMSNNVTEPTSVEVGWFGECSATLAPALTPAVERVRECIARVLIPKDAHYRVKVMLEGHTDALPVAGDCKRQFPSNWELSGARAAAVTRAVLGSQSPLAGVSSQSAIRTEMDRGSLQILAVGMGDSIAAWKAICRAEGDLEPLDKDVCRVMSGGTSDPNHAAGELVRIGVANCGSDSPAGGSLQPLLRGWANWCGVPRWAAVKREKLRRVDLRIEFEPRAEQHSSSTAEK